MPIRKSPQCAKAFYLYMNTSLSQGEIADAVKVSRKTVWNWIQHQHWAEQKRATYYSSQQEVNHLYQQLEKINANIDSRTESGCIATKEELERKKQLMDLIAGHQKNGAAWRNVAPDYDFNNKHMVDLEALGALERKNLEKRQKAAEEDAKNGPGERFSKEELDDYYSKVAKMSFGADSESAKYDEHGKPLAEDDPQRQKWEDRMRQGKRPFRGGEEEEDDDVPQE
jgi:predicted DNA-binding protein YlxM (UPF0122 family)